MRSLIRALSDGLSPDVFPPFTLENLGKLPPDAVKQAIEERLFSQVRAITGSVEAGRVTGMLLEADNEVLLGLLGDTSALRDRVEEARSEWSTYSEAEVERLKHFVGEEGGPSSSFSVPS